MNPVGSWYKQTERTESLVHVEAALDVRVTKRKLILTFKVGLPEIVCEF